MKEKITIMVMDDEEVVRNITSNMLAYLGCEVVLAADGAEAVALFRARMAAGQPIDLIILDLTVPRGEGGLEAVAAILAIDPAARVVVTSGYADDPVMVDYSRHGFKAALVKPYKLHDLTTLLDALLAVPGHDGALPAASADPPPDR